MLDVLSVYILALVFWEKLLFQTCAADLSVAQKMAVFGYVGTNVTVACGVNVEGDRVQLRWYNEDGRSELLYDVYKGAHTASSDRYRVETGNDLTITNLTTSDESRYRCSVTDAVGIDEKTTTLKVLDTIGGAMILQVGDSPKSQIGYKQLVLKSVATDYRGAKSINWTFDGRLLYEQSGIHIERSRQDRGQKYETLISTLYLTLFPADNNSTISALLIGLDGQEWARVKFTYTAKTETPQSATERVVAVQPTVNSTLPEPDTRTIMIAYRYCNSEKTTSGHEAYGNTQILLVVLLAVVTQTVVFYVMFRVVRYYHKYRIKDSERRAEANSTSAENP